MAKTISMIGIDPAELGNIRRLVFLLRHPDPMVPELARQALLYVEKAAVSGAASQSDTLDQCSMSRS